MASHLGCLGNRQEAPRAPRFTPVPPPQAAGSCSISEYATAFQADTCKLPTATQANDGRLQSHRENTEVTELRKFDKM